ncbi:MAG: hypothetical protein FKY71_16320 [Spiribacter salinus]|uniref:Uncharacterized protein n=1 Tax=Spiribacter salinus TaxID=1335746 RepID=A0A540VK52_9GAMM|nr:MAG: hypothetical protein FKY71_16320 [Spiribacter salinus]
MRSWRQDKADALLQEWAAQQAAVGGVGWPAMTMEPKVGGERNETSPERYARLLERSAHTNRAMEQLRHSCGHLWRVLWRLYVAPDRKANGQPDTTRMAEREGIAERTWRRRRSEGLERFFLFYEQSFVD